MRATLQCPSHGGVTFSMRCGLLVGWLVGQLSACSLARQELQFELGNTSHAKAEGTLFSSNFNLHVHYSALPH